MRTVKKEIVEEEKTHEYYKCDICGRDIQSSFSYPEVKEANTELRVRDYKESWNGGQDGGWINEYVYDVCGECLKDKIFPYIKQITNKEPRVYEYDW